MSKKEKSVQLDANGYRKFSMLDNVSYAAGDFGCNMSFALKSTMAVFWTQFMQMDSIMYAGLFLICQVWDAINDPLIGSIVDADKHKYKRNKFLAYVFAGSIGLIVAEPSALSRCQTPRTRQNISFSSAAMCSGMLSTPWRTCPTVPCCP